MILDNTSTPSLRITSRSTVQLPTSADILCGKDKTFNKHAGNKVFREVIASYQAKYAKTKGKTAKMNMTKEIVERMHTEFNARFVKPTRHGDWVEIGHVAARDKVSHALRFAAKAAATTATRSSPVSQRSRKCRRRELTTSFPPSFECSSNASTTSSLSSSTNDDHYFPIGDESDSDIEDMGPIIQCQQAIFAALQSADKEEEGSLYGPDAEAQLFEFELLESEDFDKLHNDPNIMFDAHSDDEWNQIMADTSL